MIRAYKYRIYPTDQQKMRIDEHLNVCRLVWNLALAVKMQAWQSNRINVSRYDLQKQLLELKKEHDWMYNVNAQAMQSVLLHLSHAFGNFFKGSGYPKFKKKVGYQSFQYPQDVFIADELVNLPKIGGIRIKLSREFDGKIKTVTVSKSPAGKYHVSILVDDGQELPNKAIVATETTVGVDLGIKDFAIASTGLKIANPKHLRGSLKRLKCLQRRAARKKKGSNNRKKANKKVALLHERIANQRKDFLHKTTSKLISDNQAFTFCVEDLNVAGMVKNHKLALSISDVGWGEFRRQMEYKCKWSGKNLLVINRFSPSSKTCNKCETVNDTLTLGHREWVCAYCGTLHDRDLNAAINIKNFGLKHYSGEGIAGEPVELFRQRKAKKQEKKVLPHRMDKNLLNTNLK